MEQNSTIQKAIKSTNLTAVILAAIAILLLSLLVAFRIKPLYNHFAGPFEVSTAELISYQGPKDTFRTYVTTYPEVALDTGYFYKEILDNGSEFVKHSYYALLFDDRLLMAKYPGSGRGDILEPGAVNGKIVKLTFEENTQVLQALTDEFPNLEEAFLPYILDTTQTNLTDWLSVIGIAILVGLSIWSLVNLIRRSGDFSKHPIARELSRFGDWEQMAREIDSQMAEPHELSGSNTHLTRDWLIFQSNTSFVAIPFRDIVWHYLYQINRRTYGIVTSTSYSVIIKDRYGYTKSLPYGSSGGSATELLKKIQVHAPWAYVGYSAELLKVWNKQAGQLVASVNARKQMIEEYLANAQQVPVDTENLIGNDLPEPDPDQVFEQEQTHISTDES
jgi:hypothetical protein